MLTLPSHVAVINLIMPYLKLLLSIGIGQGGDWWHLGRFISVVNKLMTSIQRVLAPLSPYILDGIQLYVSETRKRVRNIKGRVRN